MKPINIVIYGPFSFPNGTGATTRMRAYGRGLVKLGCSVTLYCTKPTETENNTHNFKEFGNINGINFRYLCGCTVVKKSYFLRKYQILKGLFGILKAIIRKHQKHKIDIVIYYTANSFIYTLVGWFACKVCKIRFYAETTEFPFVYEKLSLKKKLKEKFYQTVTCKLYDGMIVISRLLEEYYKKLLYKTSDILRIPIVIDTAVFAISAISHNQCVICYCGNLSNRNEIENLFEIYRKVISFHNNICLKIIGDLSKSPIKSVIMDIVRTNHLQKHVVFTGAVAHEDLPNEFASADIFILPRPSGLFSSAGLPTKLGEYLATGKPVISTKNGDIPLYLKHKINSYLVEPDDNNSFAEMILYVINHPEEAMYVGMNGKQMCFEHFDACANMSLMLAHFQKKVLEKN